MCFAHALCAELAPVSWPFVEGITPLFDSAFPMLSMIPIAQTERRTLSPAARIRPDSRFEQIQRTLRVKRKLFVYPILAVCLFAASQLSSRAQIAPQTPTLIEGTVTDPSGAVVAGAKVSIAQSVGTPRYDTVTDASGHYQVTNAAVGTYNVTAEGKGFKQAATQVTVVADSVTKADVQLAVAGVSESVVVNDATRSVFGDKSDIPLEQFPQSIQVITQKDILDMNAISLGDILTAVPSATAGPSRESTYQGFAFRIRGLPMIW